MITTQDGHKVYNFDELSEEAKKEALKVYAADELEQNFFNNPGLNDTVQECKERLRDGTMSIQEVKAMLTAEVIAILDEDKLIGYIRGNNYTYNVNGDQVLLSKVEILN